MYVSSVIDPSGFYCLCPNYYYGDRCQFQRKRITLILRLQTTNVFDHLLSTFKVVVLLVRQSITPTIVSHEQFVYTPQRHCLPRYKIQLLYPIDDSSSSFINHSVHIHVFIAQTLDHRISWQFPVSFEFLPVRRIAKWLLIPDTSIIFGSPPTTINNTNCTSCSATALCLGYDIDLSREICVCSLNRTGSRCLIPFNPCTNNSCNGHGKCIPIDIRHSIKEQFMCLCDDQWFGKQCDKLKPRIHISFARELTIPLSNIALIHIIDIPGVYEPRPLTYLHRFHKETFNFTFFVSNRYIIPNLAFIQLYEHRDQFDYYLLLLLKENGYVMEIKSEIHPSRRCRPIHELFNKTVLGQHPLRRVKNYQRPCLEQRKGEHLRCFYDDKLMCLCDETNHADCFNFQTNPLGCPWNNCSGRGICLQDAENCPTKSVCLCEPCSYGSTCQFTRAGYALSLDAIVGSHILVTASSILDQTIVIKITVLILSVLVVLGIIFNILAIGTFTRRETRESGRGLYLFVSSLVGLLTMMALIFKMILFVNAKQNSASCSLIEFLLKWWPTSCEWINACVAIERALVVMYPTRYSRSTSTHLAKWIVGSVLVFIAIVSSPELIFRRMIIDTYDERAWCVLTLNPDRPTLLKLYSTLNVFLFLIPLVINLTTSGIIILKIFHLKQQIIMKNITTPIFSKTRRFKIRLETIKEQIVKHKHILIAPVLLGSLALPRVVLAFVFVCTKLDRKPYISLIAYCIAFLPSTAVLFAFILPIHIYRASLFIFVKMIVRQCIQNLLVARQHTT